MVLTLSTDYQYMCLPNSSRLLEFPIQELSTSCLPILRNYNVCVFLDNARIPNVHCAFPHVFLYFSFFRVKFTILLYIYLYT